VVCTGISIIVCVLELADLTAAIFLRADLTAVLGCSDINARVDILDTRCRRLYAVNFKCVYWNCKSSTFTYHTRVIDARTDEFFAQSFCTEWSESIINQCSHCSIW
jgi:hypothetical protein